MTGPETADYPPPNCRADDPPMTRNAFDILTERGFVAQSTDAPGVRALLEKEIITYYIGFDPTASSLHCGSLVP